MRNYGFFVSVCLVASAAGTAAKGVWATPHDSYSSSVGVLGCKINTNRVAYWPGSVDCDNFCVKLTYEGRSVHLLRIDQSGGAYDISYDAWVYLQTGESATADPISGGTVAMEYEEVDASECADLIHTDGAKVPLSASNSMNFLTSCLAQPDSYIAKNHVLYNICDAICSLGYDEECTLDLATSNQPSCPHTLGLTSKLTSAHVYNIAYQTGETTDASTGEVVTAVDSGSSSDSDSGSDSDSDSDDTSGSDSGSTTEVAITSSASPSATPGVFFEVSTTTTTTPTVQTTTSVSTEAPTTLYSVVAASTEQPNVVETSTSVTPEPTTVATISTAISSQTTFSSQIVVNTTATRGATTLSLVTASGSPSSTSSSPSSSPTVEVTNAGHARTVVPSLVLAASFVPFLVFGLF